MFVKFIFNLQWDSISVCLSSRGLAAFLASNLLFRTCLIIVSSLGLPICFTSTFPFNARSVIDWRSLLNDFLCCLNYYEYSCFYLLRDCSLCFSSERALCLNQCISTICYFLFNSTLFCLVFNKTRSSALSLRISCLSISSSFLWLTNSSILRLLLLSLSSITL